MTPKKSQPVHKYKNQLQSDQLFLVLMSDVLPVIMCVCVCEGFTSVHSLFPLLRDFRVSDDAADPPTIAAPAWTPMKRDKFSSEYV